MNQQRWQRFLPDRSQLMLVVSVLLVVFALVSFINLAIVKGSVGAKQRSVKAQLDQARERQRMLRTTLERDQQGCNILPKAQDYYNLTLPNVTVVVPKPEATPDVPGGEHDFRKGPPYWADWWEQLSQP